MYSIIINRTILFGCTFDSVMSREEYEKLAPVQEQSAVTQVAQTYAKTPLAGGLIGK